MFRHVRDFSSESGDLDIGRAGIRRPPRVLSTNSGQLNLVDFSFRSGFNAFEFANHFAIAARIKAQHLPVRGQKRCRSGGYESPSSKERIVVCFICCCFCRRHRRKNDAAAGGKTKALFLSTTVVLVVVAKSRCPPSMKDEERPRAAILLHKLIFNIILINY